MSLGRSVIGCNSGNYVDETYLQHLSGARTSIGAKDILEAKEGDDRHGDVLPCL